MHTCLFCNQAKEDKAFYLKKEKIFPICKNCIYHVANLNKSETFYPILKYIDIPIIEFSVQRIVNKYGALNKSITRYVTYALLHDFKDFTYNDTEYLLSMPLWYSNKKVDKNLINKVLQQKEKIDKENPTDDIIISNYLSLLEKEVKW